MVSSASFFVILRSLLFRLMKKDLAVIVPARLKSVRFPRKLLYEIHGKPLILWTAHRLTHICVDIPVVFAVEDSELEDLLLSEGFKVHRTRGFI